MKCICHALVATLIWGLSSTTLLAQGFTPPDALKRLKLAEGFQAKLVANEADVRQPLSLTFDERGRLWVIQYIQYPTPAGLKAVAVDQFLRTKYDKVPEPPPRGPKGADRISILSDPDEHGRYRKVKDFVGGLNLATGIAIGHGGVFVVQPPYLLFYADKNGDDVPDGDPEVLLTGFGMEDAHAFANHLRWGPDGWLYGAQGSTVTAKIRGLEFQQGIWRYQPLTKEFELFAEGGGNTFGLDFDRFGNVIAGTNWGGKANLHQVQGGYYIKGFGKHGPLHNPFTFGYFDHVPYEKFQGGHVTCGGVLYTGGAFPDKFNDQYIAANPLSNAVHWHIMNRQGSSFTAKFGGEFVVGNDTWFRPIDCVVGPDGAVYIADWYDKRINHVDPVDNWDRSNGRLYKVEYQSPPASPERQRGDGDPALAVGASLANLSSKELVDLLSHRNGWHVREARRLLADRRDATIIPTLRKLVTEHKDQLALEALWALYGSGGFDESFAESLFDHANEHVRAWSVRLLGDTRKVSQTVQSRLVSAARSDASPIVRSQLACTAKRLVARDCLPIVRELLQRKEDLDDQHIPMLLWWAIEDKAAIDPDRVLALLDSPEAWRAPLVSKYIVERLGRRYMAEGTDAGYQTCSRLLAMSPGQAETHRLVQGMEKALEGRRLPQVPGILDKQLAELWSKQSADLTVVRFAFRLGSVEAYERALQLSANAKIADAERISLIEVLSQAGKPECVPTLLTVLQEAKSDSVRLAALSGLQAFPDPKVGEAVLELYPKMSGALRNRAQTLLCSRPAGAVDFLKAVDAGKVNPKEVALDQVRQLAALNKPELDKLIEKHWGKIGKQTSGEKQARIRSVIHILNQGKGDPARGKPLFEKNCAICHQLFGAGNKVGPDLTGADRKNTAFMVSNVVDPSSVIRPEYIAHVLQTTDGRLLTGLIVESSPQAVTLLDAKNERTVIARAKIEELKASPTSLMPEQALDPLDDQQIRDFFSYLQSNDPNAGTGGATQAPAPAQQVAKANAPRMSLRVCLVSGSLTYKSDESLVEFQKYLESAYNVQCSRAFRKSDDDLPGLENLDSCDVMLLFTRRLKLSGDQLERVKKYCQSGKPIVGVRTASHAFQTWLELDKEVLGGNYKGHLAQGLVCDVKIVDKAKGHPLLDGIKPFQTTGGLYQNPGLAGDVEVLLTGSVPDHTEPVAWTRSYKGGRIFYTSLGAQKDFEDDNFKRLLVNALFWTCKRTPEKK